MSIKIIAKNKKAHFDYHVLDDFEAGMQLMGSEVKSLRDGKVSLKDSYISFKGMEAFLQNAHIAEYSASSYNNHAPERLRKLLLHKIELERIFDAIREKGLTCIPLKLYFKKGKVKLQIALVKGKDKGDKRQDSKKRDANREIERHLRKSR